MSGRNRLELTWIGKENRPTHEHTIPLSKTSLRALQRRPSLWTASDRKCASYRTSPVTQFLELSLPIACHTTANTVSADAPVWVSPITLTVTGDYGVA